LPYESEEEKFIATSGHVLPICSGNYGKTFPN